MTSARIRRSFLEFFQSKGHTIVPSSSLMPDSPNLLFTNAGMNQFVPIFLGQRQPDVNRWAGAIPGKGTRATDTQKCIRAGGKHNDLEDVGLDTYHHTFFEMLGNWSFGDYFKREAIAWAWELVTEVWKFPKNRLYATVYRPDPTKGDPSELDREAWEIWAEKFRAAGLDPAVHIVYGDKKDNFWMMGDTGPCGPCSEIHVDLTPQGDTRGALVNKGSAQCIEIWNLVFIQFNANADGSFSPLPAKHVDTGMGFERVAGILQNTREFTDFSRVISNYETDIFRPIFDALEQLSGKKYGSTLPGAEVQISNLKSQTASDIAFRVIADHIRTLSFAIADGIQPSNEGRGYVLRRILRRAVRYGRTLGFREPFFYKLAGVLEDTMGDVFPEIRLKNKHVQDVIRGEEEAFNKTLDRGIELFEDAVQLASEPVGPPGTTSRKAGKLEILPDGRQSEEMYVFQRVTQQGAVERGVTGRFAFKLYDTYGFPLDLTELMARERGLTVDVEDFNNLMEEQKARARAAQKREVISLSQIETTAPTTFVGYDQLEAHAKVLEIVSIKNKTAVVLDASPLYAEMGGQVGDTGEIVAAGDEGRRLTPAPSERSAADSRPQPRCRIVDTQKSGNVWLHIVEGEDIPVPNETALIRVDRPRRGAIQRHHTVTHLLHWALHEVVSRDATQKGSFVGPEKLTFDFNAQPLTRQQVADIERLVNERILDNAGVTWTEIPFAEVKSRKDVMQFFGDKYGDRVRVVQIGGRAGELDGYSMELCGGTHTRATGEIGLFRIVGESAIAAGVRRIEAVAGLRAYDRSLKETGQIESLAQKLNAPAAELERKIESLLEHQKAMEKQIKSAQQREASNAASALLERAKNIGGIPAIIHNMGAADGDFLQAAADSLKARFQGVIVLGGVAAGAVALVAAVSGEFTSRIQAGKIVQQIAPIVGGKGGGRPDNARGGGKDAGKLDEALAKAEALVGQGTAGSGK